MALQLADIDDRTRLYMAKELELDLRESKLYFSRWFTDKAKRLYPDLLKKAIASGNDATLASDLSGPSIFVDAYEKQKPSGGTTMAAVPRNAPEMFAEGEFNRFYIRGLCARCLEEGKREVEIYRAKQVVNPRPESQARIGKHVDCEKLLSDLRQNIGVDTALGVPAGPNSGLSVRIPR